MNIPQIVSHSAWQFLAGFLMATVEFQTQPTLA